MSAGSIKHIEYTRISGNSDTPNKRTKTAQEDSRPPFDVKDLLKVYNRHLLNRVDNVVNLTYRLSLDRVEVECKIQFAEYDRPRIIKINLMGDDCVDFSYLYSESVLVLDNYFHNKRRKSCGEGDAKQLVKEFAGLFTASNPTVLFVVMANVHSYMNTADSMGVAADKQKGIRSMLVDLAVGNGIFYGRSFNMKLLPLGALLRYNDIRIPITHDLRLDRLPSKQQLPTYNLVRSKESKAFITTFNDNILKAAARLSATAITLSTTPLLQWMLEGLTIERSTTTITIREIFEKIDHIMRGEQAAEKDKAIAAYEVDSLTKLVTNTYPDYAGVSPNVFTDVMVQFGTNDGYSGEDCVQQLRQALQIDEVYTDEGQRNLFVYLYLVSYLDAYATTCLALF